MKTSGAHSGSSVFYVTRPSSDVLCIKGDAPLLVHGLPRLQTVPLDLTGVADAAMKLCRA